MSTSINDDLMSGGELQATLLGTDASGNTVLVGGDGAKIPLRSNSSVATRIPSGEIDALSNQLGNTFSVACRLADEFDAVRIIYYNQCATQTVGMTCAVSSPSDITSVHNSAGTWVTGTIADAAVRISTTEASFNISSWMEINGESKILYARLYIPSSGNTESSVASLYDPVAAGAALSTMTGDEWKCSKQSGDFVTTPASFNSTSIIDFNAIAGIQYRARGVVYTVAGVGDSILYGTRSTVPTNSYWMRAVRELKVSGYPIESCNLGRPSQTTTQYHARAKNTLTDLKPDALIYGAFSSNDGNPTAATVTSQRNKLSELRDAAKSAKCVLIPVTGIPYCTTNEQTSFWTVAQNDYRQEVNAVIRSLPVYIDFDKEMALSIETGVASGVKTGYLYSDLLHPSEAGNESGRVESLRAIKHAMSIRA